jgi:hypothetical protein
LTAREEGIMSWNYRVIHTTEVGFSEGANIKEDVYRIVEMFYEGDTDDRPNGWGEASPQAGTAASLYATLDMMIRACDKPVIEVCGECHNIAPGHKPDCRNATERGITIR